jgi:hypothetical protein
VSFEDIWSADHERGWGRPAPATVCRFCTDFFRQKFGALWHSVHSKQALHIPWSTPLHGLCHRRLFQMSTSNDKFSPWSSPCKHYCQVLVLSSLNRFHLYLQHPGIRTIIAVKAKSPFVLLLPPQNLTAIAVSLADRHLAYNRHLDHFSEETSRAAFELLSVY